MHRVFKFFRMNYELERTDETEPAKIKFSEYSAAKEAIYVISLNRIFSSRTLFDKQFQSTLHKNPLPTTRLPTNNFDSNFCWVFSASQI